jgi:hypothetical protein
LIGDDERNLFTPSKKHAAFIIAMFFHIIPERVKTYYWIVTREMFELKMD